MGYIRHHAIVVSSWDEAAIRRAHYAAVECCGATHAAVTPITPPAMNGQSSFLIAPDGSKEGWTDSDEANRARSAFIDWLGTQCYEDGSSALDWVEVEFGGDDDDLIAARNATISVRGWEGADGFQAKATEIPRGQHA